MNELEQVDAVLAEDGRTVVFYGHTSDPDDTMVMSFTIPEGMTPADLGLEAD